MMVRAAGLLAAWILVPEEGTADETVGDDPTEDAEPDSSIQDAPEEPVAGGGDE